jgi:ACR3 family arsenite transporter
MIVPMLLKIDLAALGQVRNHWRGIVTTVGVNWLVKPFSMALLGWLFIGHLFRPLLPADQIDGNIAGLILLAAAPCTAMVFVWSNLVDGEPHFTLSQVALNDTIMVVAFAPLVALLLGLSSITVSWDTLVPSVVLYIVVPVIVAQLWRRMLLLQGGQAALARTLRALAPLSLSALLLTLVLLFGLQGEQIMRQPIVIALLAVPILIQVYFNAGLAYWLNRQLRVEWCVAGPSALIGASNFFELAVATAIALFGFQSGAALATVVRSCCRSSISSAARVDGTSAPPRRDCLIRRSLVETKHFAVELFQTELRFFNRRRSHETKTHRHCPCRESGSNNRCNCVGCEPSGLSGRQRHFRTDQFGRVGYAEQRNGAMGQELRGLYPGATIEIEGKGSATAPPALLEGASQFGPMSRPMTAEEAAAFEKKYGYKVARFRVAVDALAVYVNKENPILCLTLQQVDQIFSSTRQGSGGRSIDTWGGVGMTGERATKPIAIYGRNALSGTYEFFKTHVLYGGDYKEGAKQQPGSAEVVQNVANDKFAIGYSGLGYKTDGVRTVPLAAFYGAKCYDTTAEATYSGKYPIARYLYIYLNKKPDEPLDPSAPSSLNTFYPRTARHKQRKVVISRSPMRFANTT